MAQTIRKHHSGSYSRPERLDLRLNASAWARTNRLFAKLAYANGIQSKADIWEGVLLPHLERHVSQLAAPPKREIKGQAEFNFA